MRRGPIPRPTVSPPTFLQIFRLAMDSFDVRRLLSGYVKDQKAITSALVSSAKHTIQNFTSSGVCWSFVVPSPSSPHWLKPHAQTVPSFFT
jgi:hypothetical protein